MFLCQFQDIFGQPYTGIHQYRIYFDKYDFAIIDIILTIICSAIFSYVYNTSFIITLCILFLLGIIVHYIFCVQTTLHKILFIYPNKCEIHSPLMHSV